MIDEHGERFERVELLLQQVEEQLDEGEPGDDAVFDEIRYHLDWVQAIAGEASRDWLWAGYVSACWHRCRARLLQDVGEIDLAIAELRTVIGYDDTFFFRSCLAELLEIRYVVTDDGDRRYLAELVAELRTLLTREPVEEGDHARVTSMLGQAVHEQFRRGLNAGEGPPPELLDEAQHLLDSSLDLFGADAEAWRSEAMLDLARLLSFRARTGVAEYARDPEADGEEAIALYESVADGDPLAAYELAELWQGRFTESGDSFARAEALRLLDGIEHHPKLEDRAGEYVQRRSELLVARARENRAELPAVIDYLVGVFAAEPVQGLVGVALMEAYWLAGDTEGVIRVVERLLAASDGENVPPREAVLPVFAIATASLALRGRGGLDEAEALLREAVREPSDLGWEKQLPLALLPVVADRDSEVPESLAASLVSDGNEKQVAAELLDWLLRHERPGADWLRAVAALRFYLISDPPSRLAALHATNAVGEPAAPDVDLMAQRAMLLAACGEDRDERDLMVQAAVALDGFFGQAAPDHPLWTILLGLHGSLLADVHVRGGVIGMPLGNAVAALEKVSADTGIEPRHRSTFLVQLARAHLLQIVSERADLHGAAIAHCKQAMSLVEPGTHEHDLAWFMLGSVLIHRYRDHGERHDHDTGMRHLLDLRASKVARGADVTDIDELLRQLRPYLDTEVPLDLALTADEANARLAELETSKKDPLSETVERAALMQVLLHRAAETNDLAMAAAAADQLGRTAGSVERGSAMYSATTAAALVGSTVAAMATGDSEKFAGGVAELEALRDSAETPDRIRETVVCSLMMLWHNRYATTGRASDLDEALRHYAGLDIGSFGLGNVTRALDGLADGCWHRRSSEYRAAATRIGFDCLRRRAHHVLLQTTGSHAAEDAADAAARGQRVALRCAASGELRRAVEAVEWGRGLVLHSATFTAGIGARLKAAGQPELAREWEQESARQDASGAVDFAPSDVRRRVLSVLGSDLEALTPPSSEEIAGALRSLDAVALVHLVPGQDEHAGRALVTTEAGTVYEVPLPLLVDGPDTAVGRYLVMSDEQRRAVLPALCAWAWRAMEPLLDRLSGGWLVLVPTGALGVVPWHAAAGAGRTALREVGVTYAASARQLCELARRERQPVGASPVVVSNPAGTLMAAQYEADFLHGLYPHGHFYGQAGPDVPVRGAGTPDEVLEEGGASLQHLGCHARAGATPAQSALELARADLSVERMLRHAAMRRDDVPGGLVVLAACESDLTAGLHDEVLTLAAAYVAAGATGVVGTKWKVDDVESALLMCVFYDFLARQGMRPRDALRAVQLWALDPDRVVPSGVARHLAERGRSAALAKPVYWAAFAHHGW